MAPASNESTSSDMILSQPSSTLNSSSSLASQPSRNTIELESKAGRITHVRVYSNRAEITRLFECNVKIGQNQVDITGLPKVLDRDSFTRADYEPRVKGITIHGAAVSVIVPTSTQTSDELKEKKRKGEKACERAKKSLPTLETYLGLLKIKPLDAQTLLEAVKSYETAAAEQECSIIKLEKELAKINAKISGEKPGVHPDLNLKATIGISNSTTSEHKIKIRFIYVVRNAAWKAEYDINVEPKESEGSENLTGSLTYKGGITQNTGEDWNDIQSLTLETTTPTFRLEIPTLTPLNIPIRRQPQNVKKSAAMSSTLSRVHASPLVRLNRRIFKNESSEKPREKQGHLDVSSCECNVGIPFETRSINISSGGMAHIVNIPLGSNKLVATKSYVCVPRKDTKTYLHAKIKNTSTEYALLSGQANVYVNNIFVLKSDVPFVSPGGTFDCPYGVEPSIRVVYHPSYRDISTSGFFTKTTNYVYSQQITISNTKALPIRETLKIIDQAPISHSDSDFTVTMVSPPLGKSGEGFGGGKVPDTNGNSRTSSGVGETKVLPKTSRINPEKLTVQVMSRIIAQWDGAEEAKVTGDVEGLGCDGKFNWVCSDIQAEETIELLLRWKVTVPDVADLTETLANVRL